MMPSLGELSSSFQTPNSRFDDFDYLILINKVIRFFWWLVTCACILAFCHPEVSLLSYMGNAGGFESEVSIHWFLEGRLLRQSGGQIPKGGRGWCEVLDSLTLFSRCYPEILATEHLENRQLISLVRQDLACSWTALVN